MSTESRPETRQQGIRFSIDTGGTFTDIVILDETEGTFTLNKSLTTPSNTLVGVLNVIEKARIDLRTVNRFFVHGSTTALNALLERKGVKTAFVTTQGFRDVPEIARFNRPEMYNPKYRKPSQVVPRELRFEVPERINATGEILLPLDTAAVRRLAEPLKRQRVRSVAVCLLHAYKNPSHEQMVRDVLREVCPGVSIAISSEVVSEHREYERGITTILNAYLAPVVEIWITELDGELRKRGFKGELILTRSDGGGMTGEFAKGSPINTLLSGPAGGVIGGMYIAKQTEYPDLITMDLGGTSFDVCMIKSGQAATARETKVSGYPLLIPNLSIRTIGAGGGSIAWLDSAGALHVGPQSAGADPGPICYGGGGTDPTVTDALLCSGYINPENFLGGEMALQMDAAKAGIAQKVCAPLGLSFDAGTGGILRLALSHMAEAINDIASENGDDPRDFALLCYGGGGPLFGASLMEELQISTAIVPVAPANFSAWGMLMIDLRHDVSMTLVRKLNTTSPAKLSEHFDTLVARAAGILTRDGVGERDQSFFKSMDMRYKDQEHTVSVPLDFNLANGQAIARVEEGFRQVYSNTYGYTLDLPAEIVTLRVKAIGAIPTPTLRRLAVGTEDSRSALKGTRRVYDYLDSEWIDHQIYDRAKLLANNLIVGPALIEEATTVSPLRRGQRCVVDALGNLIIRR